MNELNLTPPVPEPSGSPEVEQWNATPGLPKVLKLTEKRKQKLKERLKDAFWCQNYRAALQKIVASDFCMGKNNRGWRADFDWILQPDVVTKIMEGKYDNRVNQSRKIEYGDTF